MSPDFWSGIGVVVAVALPSVPYAIRECTEWRHERVLLRGRSGSPGVPPLLPLGERMVVVETTLQDHTETLRDQNEQLEKIATELSPNSGHSLKSVVNKLAADLSDLAGKKR